MPRVLLLTVLCYLLYLFIVSRLVDYREFVRTFGDNSPYITIATAIEHWNFSQLQHIKLFWGLPYTIAALSSIARLSNLNTLLTISMLASIVAVALAYKLWGAWVAMVFVILSREWLERSLLGGAEPLFLALVFAAFLAARREKWELAALLAALSTVVRPMGIFGLVGLALALFLRRDYRKLILATIIGLVIGLIYIAPLKFYYGDVLANARGYDNVDWNSDSPVAFPFAAIIHNMVAGGATKLNLARTGVWIAFILLSVYLVFKLKTLRAYLKRYPMEAAFWGLYLLFLFTYNSSWARAEFPRYAIPLVPFAVLAVEQWIPKRYWVVFVIGLLATLLSAAETVGFLNAVSVLKHAL